ncbi:copper homeostasis membrane protein CopD [Novosphingobium pentaromativorans]|uniref:Copper resistance D n=1 Tax=Novosphingobium pentaromativorans US6-1 TaxID=1088721 RepID=G6EFY8_9SPHN|nr:copper homeostasis membrane protein CopD [Novosphingobium pentaromativorans]AIT82313.1 copper resistance protein CopD [Novosphingobium pentaromativorans US6-1]EHJ59677.1 copper resistance D [Novosphingobium pentaromativorans US6-1]
MADGILIASRLAAFILLLLAAGLPIYRLTDGQRTAGKGQRWLMAMLTIAASAVSCLWALASIAVMAASSLTDLDAETVSAVLGATPLGDVLIVRTAALAALLLMALIFPRQAVLAPFGALALATCAWTGHAGAGEGISGQLHQVSDVIHLIAAATWLGALCCFVRDGLDRANDADKLTALSRFARTGTLIVVLLAVTGIANGYLITAPSGLVPGSTWSLLIAAKVLLFIVMLALAADNRWRLVPALATGLPGARQRLTGSLIAETGCAIAIVALVAFAGMLDPSGL